MREEIAYREMQEEMGQNKQGQKAMDPTMKDQQSSSSTSAGTADPTRKDESMNVAARTRQTDQRDAQRAPGADRMPTADEEQAAERAKMPAGAAKNYKEALERGANQKGEGRIE